MKSINGRLHDIVVIGGGITGLGVALEASRHGFDTVLLERNKICGATSDNSLRIIHGGFRYLQSLNFKRVLESLKEQRDLLRESGAHVRRLPCVMPLKKWGLKSRFPASVAAAFYNLLTKKVTGKSNHSRFVSSAVLYKNVPILTGCAPYGALLWYDARLKDPAQFAVQLRSKIEREGGEVREHIEARAVERDLDRLVVKAVGSEGLISLRSRVVVNATGPWINDLFPILGEPAHQLWCKSFNVVLNRSLEGRFAIGIEGRDRRLFFVVPRDGVSVIGTEYLPNSDDPLKVQIAEAEVAKFIADLNEVLPRAKLSMADVDRVEFGVLPLRNFHGSTPIFYGSTRVTDEDGYLGILSTKYTTFRSSARSALKVALRYLRK